MEKSEPRVEFLDLGRPIETRDALNELDERGFRPATLSETPIDMTREWSVVVLGTVERIGFGNRVYCMHSGYTRWEAVDSMWPVRYRFAAVKKQ